MRLPELDHKDFLPPSLSLPSPVWEKGLGFADLSAAFETIVQLWRALSSYLSK